MLRRRRGERLLVGLPAALSVVGGPDQPEIVHLNARIMGAWQMGRAWVKHLAIPADSALWLGSGVLCSLAMQNCRFGVAA